MRTIGVVVVCALVVSVATACSGSDGDDPGITRIDGPAVVDGDQDGVRDG